MSCFYCKLEDTLEENIELLQNYLVFLKLALSDKNRF